MQECWSGVNIKQLTVTYGLPILGLFFSYIVIFIQTDKNCWVNTYQSQGIALHGERSWGFGKCLGRRNWPIFSSGRLTSHQSIIVGTFPINNTNININKTHSVSTKTGLADYSSFLVWKKVSPMITKGQSTTIFLCIRPFFAWWHLTEKSGDPIASLILTSVKAVFCNIDIQINIKTVLFR